jgi:hypothetical protein
MGFITLSGTITSQTLMIFTLIALGIMLDVAGYTTIYITLMNTKVKKFNVTVNVLTAAKLGELAINVKI